MKTKEELNRLKAEYTELNKKLAELTEEELSQVTGGVGVPFEAKKKESDNGYSRSFNINETEQQFDIHIYDGTSIKEFEPSFSKNNTKF